jgi:hypothetical protein
MLMQSNSLFVSIFHNLIFSLLAANTYSLSSNVRCVIALESYPVIFIAVNYSKSQYLTVLSVEPLARARL